MRCCCCCASLQAGHVHAYERTCAFTGPFQVSAGELPHGSALLFIAHHVCACTLRMTGCPDVRCTWTQSTVPFSHVVCGVRTTNSVRFFGRETGFLRAAAAPSTHFVSNISPHYASQCAESDSEGTVNIVMGAAGNMCVHPSPSSFVSACCFVERATSGCGLLRWCICSLACSMV